MAMEGNRVRYCAGLRGGHVIGAKRFYKNARIADKGRCERLKVTESTDVAQAEDYGNARNCPIQVRVVVLRSVCCCWI